MTEISEQRWHDVLEQLRSVVARRGVRGADIHDVVQTAVEKAIRNLRTLADEERFEPWLKRIAANAALDQMRSVQRKGVHEELDKAENIAGDVDDADPLIDFVDCIAPFLGRLAPADADIIRARDIDGGSYPELAAQLGLSVPGVKSRVQRARAAVGAAGGVLCRARAIPDSARRRGGLCAGLLRAGERGRCGPQAA